MKTVIALFSKDDQVQQSIERLQDAGITRDRIKVLAFEDTVADLLNGYQSLIMAKYAGWGVIISALFFVLYEVIGRICDCGITIYGLRVELDNLALFVLVGAILGVVIGYLAGVEHLEGSLRPYIWNVHQGNRVVAVQVEDEIVTDVTEILYSEQGVAIRTLETRLHSFLRPKHRNLL